MAEGLPRGVERTRYGTYRIRYVDQSGRRRAESFPSAAEAGRAYRKALGDVDRGEHVDPRRGKTKLREWADDWLAGARNLGKGGRDTYRTDLDRYILPKLGNNRLDRLDDIVIDRFLTGLLDRGLAPSTVHRQYRTLNRCLAVAVQRGYLVKNPCAPVQPPRIPDTEMHFLTASELDALHDAFLGDSESKHGRRKAQRYAAWVWVAGYGGLRWSECVGLQRRRVDGRRLTVLEQLIRRADGEWHRDEVKSRAGRRVVTLPQFAADELAEHLGTWSQPGPDGLVFPTGRGTPPSGRSFSGNVFKPALERAGLPRDVRIHDLRHTAVALAIRAGAHPKAIQVRMGHSSIQVTLDRYGHLYPEMDEEIADGLDTIRADARRASMQAV